MITLLSWATLYHQNLSKGTQTLARKTSNNFNAELGT